MNRCKISDIGVFVGDEGVINVHNISEEISDILTNMDNTYHVTTYDDDNDYNYDYSESFEQRSDQPGDNFLNIFCRNIENKIRK